jgi:erythronate-4-phosphate dehydrogenase
MKIVCAETVLLAQEAFSTAGETIVIPDRAICRDDLLDADALIIRSKTKATRELLEGTPVKFVGTATAGTDHLDEPFLQKQGIYACAAPGCNANSVSEYITAALLTLANRHHFSLADKTIGIIGCGHVGTQVQQKAAALGMQVLRNDPPLEAIGSDPNFVSLDTLLANSDIVTLHIPLIHEKPWPTFKLADYLFFEKLRPGTLFINAARGSVVDYDAFLLAKQSGIISHAIIDVWDPEPAFRTDILDAADLASVHIAGHSYEGKLNGTIAVYNELCNFFEIEKSWNIAASLPPPPVPHLSIDTHQQTDEEILHNIVQQVYDIETDDRLIRSAALAPTPERAKNFDRLRATYRERREFNNTTVTTLHAPATLNATLRALGFMVRSE